MMDILMAAAGRRDNLVTEWLNMADSDADDDMLKIVPDCFMSLNSKITVAIRAITRTADNDYSSEMDMLRDKKVSSALLYLRKLYKYLRVSDDNVVTKAMSNFRSVTLKNVNSIGQFSVLMKKAIRDMKKSGCNISDKEIAHKLVDELNKHEQLKSAVYAYEMAEPGTDQNTSGFLFRKLDKFKADRQGKANDDDEMNMFCGIPTVVPDGSQTDEAPYVPVAMGATIGKGSGKGGKGEKEQGKQKGSTHGICGFHLTEDRIQ